MSERIAKADTSKVTEFVLPHDGERNDPADYAGDPEYRERLDAAYSQRRTLSGPEPLCDLADLRVDAFLDDEPPERHWILEDLLPLGVVGLLAAGGGTGKSFLTLQLAVSVATGRPFLGIPVHEVGSVLMLAAEDEREELHRRLWRIVQAMREGGEFTATDAARLKERLFIGSRVGDDNRLTQVIDGTVTRTNVGERIRLTAEQIDGLKLVILDPVSRFRGGPENDNDAATIYAETVERLRAETGATVLQPHHLSKSGLRAGTEGLSAEGIRGASALLDAVRWAAAMATLRKDDAAEFGIDPDEANRFVRLDLVKGSYGPPWPGLWLERTQGGVLVPTDMPTRRQQKQEQRGAERYRDVLSTLKGLIAQQREKGAPLTRRRLRDYAGTAGIFGCSDKTLRGIVERALAEGEIKLDGEELRTW